MPQITLSVPDAKWPEYKKYFLIAFPKEDQSLTDEQWIKRRILMFAHGAYSIGREREFNESNKPVINKDIIT